MVNGVYPDNRTSESQRKITVNGEGTVKASPDLATATLGVRTENLNLQEAQAENAKKANDLVNALVGLAFLKKI